MTLTLLNFSTSGNFSILQLSVLISSHNPLCYRIIITLNDRKYSYQQPEPILTTTDNSRDLKNLKPTIYLYIINTVTMTAIKHFAIAIFEFVYIRFLSPYIGSRPQPRLTLNWCICHFCFWIEEWKCNCYCDCQSIYSGGSRSTNVFAQIY